MVLLFFLSLSTLFHLALTLKMQSSFEASITLEQVYAVIEEIVKKIRGINPEAKDVATQFGHWFLLHFRSGEGWNRDLWEKTRS
jgi:hypothetical protein